MAEAIQAIRYHLSEADYLDRDYFENDSMREIGNFVMMENQIPFARVLTTRYLLLIVYLLGDMVPASRKLDDSG